MKYDAVVVAYGLGKRSGLKTNKVLFKMKNGKTVLENSCHLFIEDKDCNKVVVVTKGKVSFSSPKVVIVPGGKRRCDSVYMGLQEVESKYVLIHDGVRPYLSKTDLEKLKKSIAKNEGAILAHSAVETVKCVEKGTVKRTINRDKIYCAMTPQAFKTDLIKKAYDKVDLNDTTDDASIFEKANYKVRIVEGSRKNIKLTNKEDFENI